MFRRLMILLGLLALLAAACTQDTETPVPERSTTTAPSPSPVAVPPADTAVARNQAGHGFPPSPSVPTGPPDAALTTNLDALFGGLEAGVDLDVIATVGSSGDPRAAWLLADLLRFIRPGDTAGVLVDSFETLTGVDLSEDPISLRSSWQSMTDHLIAWDLPALDGYVEWKRQLFTLVEERWEPFFADAESAIDWRVVSWGGVLPDDRPLGSVGPCVGGCIPALDDPVTTDAAGGDWYPSDGLVFGVSVNGESRAYPKNIMEVHEMVNDTIGGRRLGIPYCTLCGSAQAYFTDTVPADVEVPVLRTSGLLSRSNKVMYDLVSHSVFDTFTGEAVSGPLRERGIVLDQASVVTSTWEAWKEAHPETTIVAQDGGIGRYYDADPLGGRDDDGPIFPIGSVDGRLAVQAKVLGVIDDDGIPVAFDVVAAIAVLSKGGEVESHGVTLVLDGSGVRSQRVDGTAIPGHEAFWFAWSQFYPDSDLWTESDRR